MKRFFVKTPFLFLFLLPALAGCGLSEFLEPDVIDNEPEVREFEDTVQSVDLTERTIMLGDGSTIRIVDGTERESDDWGRTFDLAAVHDALEAEWPVHAWGEGEVEQDDPLTLRADRLGLAVEQPRREFEGPVTTVELEDGTLCLADLLIVLEPHTMLLADQNGEIHDLAAAHQALAMGREVVAWGVAEVDPENEHRIVALKIGFEIEAPVLEDFAGPVERVLLDHGKIELVDGTYVRVTEMSTLALGDGSEVDLVAVHEALEAGREVIASGVGEVANEDPLILDALRIVFEIEPAEPGLESFSGVVDYIDTSENEIVLRTDLGEVVVLALASTQITAANAYSPDNVSDAEQATWAGRRLRVTGTGTVEDVPALTFAAATIVFEVEIEEFDADIASTDGWLSFTLTDGRRVQLFGANTVVTPFDADSPTDVFGIQAALDAGDRVRAAGFGFVLDLGDDYAGPSLLDAGDVTIQRIPAPDPAGS